MLLQSSPLCTIFLAAFITGRNSTLQRMKLLTPCTMSYGIPAIHHAIAAFGPLITQYGIAQAAPKNKPNRAAKMQYHQYPSASFGKTPVHQRDRKNFHRPHVQVHHNPQSAPEYQRFHTGKREGDQIRLFPVKKSKDEKRNVTSSTFGRKSSALFTASSKASIMAISARSFVTAASSRRQSGRNLRQQRAADPLRTAHTLRSHKLPSKHRPYRSLPFLH